MGFGNYLAYKAMQLFQPWLFPLPCSLEKLKQSPRVSFNMLVYAHRGGALERPELIENTMAAFNNAAALNVDLLELDVQLTKDSQVAVFHDSGLERMAGPQYKKKTVHDFTCDELPDIVKQIKLSSDDLQTEDNPCNQVQAQFRERIPLLSEIFKSFPEVPVQVDVKVDQPGLVQAVHSMVQSQQGRKEKLLWGSFRHKVQSDLYRTDPTIPLFMSAWRSIFVRLAHAVGQLDKVPVYESAAIVPWRLPRWLYQKDKHWYPWLDRSWVDAMKARGVDVIFFGSDLNDEAAYKACLDAGAAGICTDRPSLLQAFLNKTQTQSLHAA